MYRRFARWLARPSAIDGRLIVLAAVLVCAAFLGAMSAAGRENTAWKLLGTVPQSAPARDLRTLPDAQRCFDNGDNPYLRNDCDVEKRPFNYPRVWLVLNRLGLTADTVPYWRFAASAVFFAVACLVLGRLTVGEGVVAAAIVCSPVVWFGIEVGNIDYWIFSLLGIAVLLFRRGNRAGYALLFAAAVLKIFPAASFIAALREKSWKRIVLTAAALGAAFAVYVSAIFSDLVLMLKGTPHMEYISFGRAVLFGTFGMPERAANLASLALLGACAAFAIVSARTIARRGEAPPGDHRSLTAFRIGGAIFALAFAAPSSFDYRLGFLILTVPQLFAWVRRGDRWGAASALALCGIVMAFWGYRGPWTKLGLDELVNWALFTYLATALVVTLPGFVAWHETCKRTARS